MLEELKHAYPLLKRQWASHGKVFRRDGVRGEPDFMLTAYAWPRIPMYVEVKAATPPVASSGLSILQALCLDELSQARLLTRILILVDNANWWVSNGPFVNEKGYVKSGADLKWRVSEEVTPDFLLFSEFLQGTEPLKAP